MQGAVVLVVQLGVLGLHQQIGHTLKSLGLQTLVSGLLRKELLLFLQEAADQGLHAQGLQGVADLLMQAKDTELDDQDYCALHALTGQS